MTSDRRTTGSKFTAVLRTVALAILIAFVVGLVIGTMLRRELERPVRYIGTIDVETGSKPSALAGDPRDVGHAGPSVLVTGDHEEQVG